MKPRTHTAQPYGRQASAGGPARPAFTTARAVTPHDGGRRAQPAMRGSGGAMPLALHLCERTEPPGVSTAEEWGGEEASAHLHSAREGSKMPSSMGMLAAIVAGASSDLDGSLPSVHLSRANGHTPR